MYDSGDNSPTKHPAWSRARYWYKRAAKQGYAKAAHNLGLMCMKGMGGEMEDADGAFKWWSMAAEDNMGASQRNLGILYEGGMGVEKSAEKATYWFRRAAQRSDGEEHTLDAQFRLAGAYFTGRGVEADKEQAKAWLGKAASSGHQEAQKALKQVVEEEEAEAEAEAARLLAEQGDEAEVEGDEGEANGEEDADEKHEL